MIAQVKLTFTVGAVNGKKRHIADILTGLIRNFVSILYSMMTIVRLASNHWPLERVNS